MKRILKELFDWAGTLFLAALCGHFAYFFLSESTCLVFKLEKVYGATRWQWAVGICFLLEKISRKDKATWLSSLFCNVIEFVFYVMVCANDFWRGQDILDWLTKNHIPRFWGGVVCIILAGLIITAKVFGNRLEERLENILKNRRESRYPKK